MSPRAFAMIRPSRASPRFDYSIAVAGGRVNGTPPAKYFVNASSGNGVAASSRKC